jgi:hypothetical protein
MEDAVRVDKFPILIVTMLFLIMFIGTQPVPPVLAASIGPLYPSTGSSGSAGAGTIGWNNLTNITSDIVINAEVTSLDVNPITGIYGDNATLSATLSPAVSGKTISFTLDGEAACSTSTDTNGLATCQAQLLANVGSYPTGVGAIFAGDEDYEASSNTASLDISPKAASVGAVANSKTYGDTDPPLSTTNSGFLAADLGAGKITFSASRAAGESVAGSPYLITPAASDNGSDLLNNYTVTLNTASFTINPKTASVSAVANTKTYGDADPTLSTTNSGFLAADLGAGKITFSASRAAGETVAGSPYPITPAASDNGSDLLNNYTVTLNTANFTINPKTASVSAVANSKTYGDADPTLSTTYSGFLAADLGAGKITFSASRAAGETVAGSPYLITPAASDNGSDLLDNYTVSLNPANFSITKKAASVSAVANSKTYGAPDPALSTTNNGFVAADLGAGKITFSASRAAGESVAGSPYPITPAASDSGTGLLANYTVSYANANFTVTKADPVCTITPYTVEYDRLTHTATGSCVGVLAETLFGLDLSGTTHVAVGSYTLDPWVYTDFNGNYNNANGTVIDQITRRFITVTADNTSKMIGTPDPWLTYLVTAGSLLPGDSFIGSLTREPGEKPGTYQILQGSLALLDYYQLSFIGADFTIYGDQIFMPLIVH